MTGGFADLTHSPQPTARTRPPDREDRVRRRAPTPPNGASTTCPPTGTPCRGRREAVAVDTTGIPASRVAETAINRLGQQDG